MFKSTDTDESSASSSTRTCIGCLKLKKTVKELNDEVTQLTDRLESARDQIMGLLLKQRNKMPFSSEDMLGAHCMLEDGVKQHCSSLVESQA